MSILLEGGYWGKKPTPEMENSGFFTHEIFSEINEAIDFNANSPLYISYYLYFFIDGYDYRFDMSYMPFSVYPNHISLQKDFVFNYDNVHLSYLSNYAKQQTIQRMNVLHQYAHLNGYDTFYGLSPENKYYSSLITTKNHHINPLNIKYKYLDFYPNKITFHDVFNIPRPIDDNDYTLPHWEWHPLKYAFDTGSIISPSPSTYGVSKIKIFVSGSSVNGVTGVNPSLGLIEHNDYSPFWGGKKVREWHDYNTNSNTKDYQDLSSLGTVSGYFNYSSNINNFPKASQYVGYIFLRGFDVEDFTDEQLLIKKKYLIVYRDRSDEIEHSFNPSLCCLAQCFGITE